MSAFLSEDNLRFHISGQSQDVLSMDLEDESEGIADKLFKREITRFKTCAFRAADKIWMSRIKCSLHIICWDRTAVVDAHLHERSPFSSLLFSLYFPSLLFEIRKNEPERRLICVVAELRLDADRTNSKPEILGDREWKRRHLLFRDAAQPDDILTLQRST